MSSADISQPRAIPHIPFEIARKIAYHLDLQTAFSLSLTCKALRDVGECRLWSAINLCSSLDIDEDAPMLDITFEQYQPIISQLESAISALESYPLRAECVNTLISPTIPYIDHHLFLRLIELVKPHLDILSLIMMKSIPSSPITNLESILKSHATWPKLHTIRLSTPNPLDIPLLLRFLQGCPNVRNLEFCFTNFDIALPEIESASKTQSVPHLPSLTHMSLTHFGHRTLVPALLAQTPNLVEFTMKGEWNFETPDEKAIFRALQKLDKLKGLNWLAPGESWYAIGEIRHFKGLEQYAEVSDSLEDESYELDLESTEWATTGSLIRLIQTRGMRPSPEAYLKMGIESIPIDKRNTLRLAADFTHCLYHAPRLTEILYLREYPDSARPSVFRPPISSAPSDLTGTSALLQFQDPYHPPELWEEKGMRGVTIRTYAASSTGHFFVHVRALTRAAEHKGRFYVGERRQWHDLTRYRGRHVPFIVLREMYETQGISLDWTDGKRDMELKEETWKVLEKWFEETDPLEDDDPTTEPPPGMDHDLEDAHADDEDDDMTTDDDDDGGGFDEDEGDVWESEDDWVDEDEEEDEDGMDGHMAGNGWW